MIGNIEWNNCDILDSIRISYSQSQDATVYGKSWENWGTSFDSAN